MAIKITDECINCGACEPECPNNAIYEGGVEWAFSDGTTVRGEVVLMDGTVIDAEQRMAPLAVDIYYITPNKCTECQGFHEEPQCVLKSAIKMTQHVSPISTSMQAARVKPKCSVLTSSTTLQDLKL